MYSDVKEGVVEMPRIFVESWKPSRRVELKGVGS
jgi:hypothetical protein